MIRKTAWGAAAAALVSLPAHAVDSISLELGYGSDTRVARAGVQWNWRWKRFSGRRWELGGYWDLSLGVWDGNDVPLVYDLGLTPVFRLERPGRPWPYVEAAIGLHQISDLRISSSKVVGTNFQFGDHLGIGLRFGEGARYDLGLRLQHLSNGGIRDPNPGIDFLQLRFQLHLR